MTHILILLPNVELKIQILIMVYCDFECDIQWDMIDQQQMMVDKVFACCYYYFFVFFVQG